MKNLIVCLFLAFSIVNLPLLGQDSSDSNASSPKFNIVIDAETRKAIANGNSDAVIAVLAAANVDANDPAAVSEAVQQIVDLIESSTEEN